jgi:N-acetylmuramoyl-L-alanine amidase
MGKLIILDNGHGKETPGKRSPVWKDGSQLFEWEFNRDVVRRIQAGLQRLGIEYHILVPESQDISLVERCRRANAIYAKNRDAILVSVHANAGGGTGWECFTSPSKTKSDGYATILCEEAKKAFPAAKMRFDLADGDPDKEDAFHILKHTACPAVLTENFFMDFEPDCRIIMSNEGRQKIADFHIKAMQKFAV